MYTTVYPTGIPQLSDLPNWVDNVDDVEALVVNDPKTELLAALTEMGTLPKGTHASVKDRLVAVEMLSKIHVYLSAAEQTVTKATWEKVEFDGTLFDPQAEFDLSVNFRFTADEAGYYLVTSTIQYTAAEDGKTYQISIRKNGSGVSTAAVHASSTTSLSLTITDVIYLAATQYVEIWTYHDSVANKNLKNHTSKTYLAIHKLS